MFVNGDQAFGDNHEIALAGRHTEIVFDSIFGLHADLEVPVSCEELEHLDHAIDPGPLVVLVEPDSAFAFCHLLNQLAEFELSGLQV